MVAQVCSAAQVLQVSTSSARCRNDGTRCRCSKMNNKLKMANTPISLCARPRGALPSTAGRPLTMHKCTLELCDLPFECDCDGAYMCHIAAATQHWSCTEDDDGNENNGKGPNSIEKGQLTNRHLKSGQMRRRRRLFLPVTHVAGRDEGVDDGVCSCSRKTRPSAVYPLRVMGAYNERQHPSPLCDWDDDFWA